MYIKVAQLLGSGRAAARGAAIARAAGVIALAPFARGCLRARRCPRDSTRSRSVAGAATAPSAPRKYLCSGKAAAEHHRVYGGPRLLVVHCDGSPPLLALGQGGGRSWERGEGLDLLGNAQQIAHVAFAAARQGSHIRQPRGEHLVGADDARWMFLELTSTRRCELDEYPI